MPVIGGEDGLFSRAREWVREKLQRGEPSLAEQITQESTTEPLSYGRLRYRIGLAGRNRLIAKMKYHGMWRDVEVYSYRYRDKDTPHIPLLYAYSHKDGAIRSYKLLKVQGFALTRRAYSPRWPVEF